MVGSIAEEPEEQILNEFSTPPPPCFLLHNNPISDETYQRIFNCNNPFGAGFGVI